MIQTPVAVIGLWHLGCIASACLAELGYDVVGVDFDKGTVDNLKKNILPLFEPGLDELIKKNTASKLVFTTDFKKALADKKFIIITFDTPVNNQDQPDTTVIYKAVEKIVEYAPDNCVVIVMSQVPVGTCHLLEKYIRERRPGMQCDIVYNPENLMLGQAIKIFTEPDRVIIGLDNPARRPEIEKFYSVINGPKIYMDLLSAEMVKHATNAFLATSVSFINEIADICEVFGADVRRVVEGLKADKRIGVKAFLNPGLGFAGGTLGRDLAILSRFKIKSLKTPLIKATIKVNRGRKKMIVAKIQNILGTLKGKKIALLGLTYKPGTSTLRRAMSLEIARQLMSGGATISAYDPKISVLPKQWANIQVYTDAYSATKEVDCVLLITDWPEFKELDYKKIHTVSAKAVVIDCKNFLIPEQITQAGLAYYGIGFKVT